jgi:hypothetical protein
MSPARKKTKAAKPAARKAPARTTAAGKKAATKPSAAKTAKPKAKKAKTAKARTTKAKKAKKTKDSAAPRTAAAAKAPTAAPAPKKAAPRKRAPSRRRRAKQVHAPASEVLPQRTPVAGEPRSKLGSKWGCFSCGAKFYDLNKPEPLCPRCGANQLKRPKPGSEVKPPPPPRAGRAMAPLLDEDEDAMVVNREELDLGVARVDEAVGEFIDSSESEEDSADEEDEES